MDVVIGAGMGGLAAAIRLVRAGRSVTLLEARDRAGGLAGGLDLAGRQFDGGPYILLDRPGLEWAFRELGADPEALLDLVPLDEVYRVRWPDGDTLSLYRDLDRTADAFEARFPGSGDRYRAYVRRMSKIYDRLMPLQRERPGPMKLVTRGLVREGLFLLRGLQHHLQQAGLPDRVVDLLGIWTHIAGQPLSEAPAPLAFVPAIVHTHGAWTVRGGIRRIPEALERLARTVGVRVRLGARAARIVRDGRRVLGIDLGDERLDAERVFSDVGIGTYLRLLDPPDPHLAAEVAALPLQSPGVAAWMTAEVDPAVPFLEFLLPAEGKVRLRVNPGAVDDTRRGQVRFISPVDHAWAEQVGPDGQRAHLQAVLDEPWWREGLSGVEVHETRIPSEWGQRYHLWRDAMNPVMTAAFMRSGRLPHVSPAADGLYLCGSATHPGQWVSFCAISGILAADAAG